MRHIFKCQKCGKYTMDKKCSCGGKAINPKPAKFNLEDKYGKYRRKVKREKLKEENLY